MIKCTQCGEDTNNPKFCSRKCSAIYNNTLYAKRDRDAKNYRNCKVCNKEYYGYGKHCSKECYLRGNENTRIATILCGMASAEVVRNYLIKKDRKCTECNLYLWNNKPIILELHHKNGDKGNNSLDNVILLCPNCHSQTDNYKAKNVDNPNGLELRRNRYNKWYKRR